MTQAHTERQNAGQATPGSILAELEAFEGSPEDFLRRMLWAQVRLTGTAGGAVFRLREGQADLLAIWPESTPPETDWVQPAAALAAKAVQGDAVIDQGLSSGSEMYDQSPHTHLVAMRLRVQHTEPMVTVLLLQGQSEPEVERTRRNLQALAGLAGPYELRRQLAARQSDLNRLRDSLEAMASMNERSRFMPAAMGLCNDLAERWHADRVGIGLLRGRHVKLLALSHSEKFTRKMQAVQGIEAAMEECLDQDLEVLHPAPPETPVVSRAAKSLAARAGEAMTVLCLPLRRDGKPVGAVCIERPEAGAFTTEQVEALRLTCDLVTARLTEMDDRDRWFGARAAKASRRALATVLGARHTWAKAAALAVIAIVLVLVFVQVPYRVQADAAIQPVDPRQIVAPFEGVLGKVVVKPGDSVNAGEVLARLKTDQLELRLVKAREEFNAHVARENAAMNEGKQHEVEQARAQQRAAQAEIDLLELWMEQAVVTSPISGRVLQGDWTRQSDPPVERGDLLFELSQDELRAELQVPEDRIADVRVGAAGEVATVQSPGRKIPFEVEWISPVAEPTEGGNVFRVRVKLTGDAAGLRPGLEGVAKIDVEKRSLGWIVTHRLTDWVRMNLWW